MPFIRLTPFSPDNREGYLWGQVIGKGQFFVWDPFPFLIPRFGDRSEDFKSVAALVRLHFPGRRSDLSANDPLSLSPDRCAGTGLTMNPDLRAG
jgi:hypothetical protein